ncbi:hypothetical protein JIX56_16115 [Streptomyces sp. CA-210063]|uniref:hypothetical protein n=1 Tax=Streptomyces sp. CA-210063 TaxID=2801029 RepID=UPI00214BEB69|nr:hypothetical protein [Streptomyces sp. CA-210063]UUU31304.1 hypothetical protein JIX56_16115 [Streptomyces sp. CA-210063]
MRCQIDIDARGRFGWRLVASNGRSVAVSPAVHESHARCRAAFMRVCGLHATLGGGIQHTAEGSGWVWFVWDGGGRSVATSARTYERHATCRASYERFRALLATLDPGDPELWGES